MYDSSRRVLRSVHGDHVVRLVPSVPRVVLLHILGIRQRHDFAALWKGTDAASIPSQPIPKAADAGSGDPRPSAAGSADTRRIHLDPQWPVRATCRAGGLRVAQGPTECATALPCDPHDHPVHVLRFGPVGSERQSLSRR